MELLERLIEVQGASGDEGRIRDFILDYVKLNQDSWAVKPTIIEGPAWQDVIILVFGQPRTAIYAHIDSIGFSVGYDDELIKIGGPRLLDGVKLVGVDSNGPIETEMIIHEDEHGVAHPRYLGDRKLDRGTVLTFAPNYRETADFIQSPYMDNRLGVWSALKVAETLKDGAIVFSTYEEHGGNSVAEPARYLKDKYGVYQALISDITWVTDGVGHGKGVAISMRDSSVPRRSYLNRIIDLAKKSGLPFQLEVESAGGSDGSALQKSHVLMDWCFIGAAEDNVHSPDEKVHKADIEAMVNLYSYLMEKL
jgi:putative aminopeptidase FrvX